MERSLTKIRDVDLKILSELDDRDLLNYCRTHKYGNELCNNEDFWRNRVQIKFPGAEKIKSPNMNWKIFYLKIIYYSNKYEGGNRAMLEAAKRNDIDMVQFFVMQGAFDFEGGLQLAAKKGNRKLVDFFIEQAKSKGREWGQWEWDFGLRWSAYGGHIDLMKFFIAKGADDLDSAMNTAAMGGQKNAIDYLISQGVNKIRKI